MQSRVVVTGLGMITPLGLDTETTWHALLAGKSGIDYISSFDTEGFETRFAGEVRDFDPVAYMPSKEARHTDRFVQFAMAATQAAVAQAHLSIGESVAAERVATIVGSGIGGIMTISQQFDVLRNRGPSRVSPFVVPMMIADMASGKVSMMLGAKGPNFCIVSACSSGADAIGEGYEMVQRGEVDVAVVGGSEACLCSITLAGFSAAGALSRHNHDPKGASRPFDAERDGFVLAEGAAILVLESEEHALHRNAEPLAEVAGYGATADAYHITQPAPGGEGAVRAMRIALAKARLRPEEIDHISAHGTSTPMNDKFETMAIKEVFGAEAPKIRINAVKSMTGHLVGASGALEAAVTVLTLKHQVIPPTINLENPDPECDLDYTPYTPRRGAVRCALSNSLGFGGHNSALVFRTYPG